jgi:pimeloyl-ACP methyl ester carboxylesterase
MRSRTLAGALVVAVAFTGGTIAPAAPATAAPTITWKPCGDPDPKEVDCGSIEVPLDWAKPNGQKITIGLARRKATGPGTRIGAVLVDPGGPGGSGVELVRSFQPFTAKVSARFDTVGFDPRGINASTQLRCDGDLSAASDAAKHPTSQAEFDKLARINRKLHDSCRKHSGKLASHVDNLNTARDMDAIRAALGEKKLTYVGYSYGSLMGQQYAELFPNRVRALVMDGNMDHSLRTAWEFMRTETAPIERGFVLFAKWCDSTKTCALYGKNTKRVYAQLRQQAKAGTLVDADGNKIDFYELAGNAFGVMSPQAWGELAKYFDDLSRGKAAKAVKVAGSIVNDPYPSIWCSDWSYPVKNYAHYAALRKLLAWHFPNIQWSPYVDHALTCVNSGTKNTNPQQRLRIKGAPPLVMVGNVHDPATVYEWNKAAARQSGAHLITYEGWGHTAYGWGVSPCVDAAVDAYLIDLKVPKRGLRCPAMEKPGSGEPMQVERTPFPVGPYGTF